MSEFNTTEIEGKEILQGYEEKFNEFEEELSEMMGTTVINQKQLKEYLLSVTLFFMSELTEIKKDKKYDS